MNGIEIQARCELKAIAGLLGHLSIVVPPHLDYFAHLIDSRPEPDPDSVHQGIPGLFEE